MAKVTEVVKEIAQTWQKLAKEDRTNYNDAANSGKYYFFQFMEFEILI